mmetsp:Transcript_10311/g.30247  ORF Transcript_10311/g.30247 Transcript_10311/m.30247 type:complete len:122 (+) Transcript_10311:65-430(+)|eukprot:CAMPEP_0168386120 /NCGR_PEP_ID=MMETSP0228-20121227/15265_1 /TAXON_ID=133427 /ORGANISM="Protoceratium reticulatum, Strain CCCM 535 (=CCMP 1889)" /LENGTH=121 /DNA_ID=CAMNT_0008399313 /DNA_START=65 /DNA_END=430 /DNA_ORIENTATION=+
MGRHHCGVCGERDIETGVCEKCGAGEDGDDICEECAERCCMPGGKKNRLYDTELVKKLLESKVKTSSLTLVLKAWLKKHANGEHDSVHESDDEGNEDEEEVEDFDVESDLEEQSTKKSRCR